MKKLKRKIIKEIEQLNNSNVIINDKITSSIKKNIYEEKEKEHKLKSELNLKINEIRNELENYLSKINDLIISLVISHESSINFEKQSKNNQIKALYYIEELKYYEKSIIILKTKMKNCNIFYENNNSLNFEDYYFNGIPIPKDIKVEKNGEKLLITWDLEDENNIDNKKIKYFISIRDNIYDSTYETFDKFIYIDEYKENNNYKIQVRILIDDCYSDWSEIKEYKHENKMKNENCLGFDYMNTKLNKNNVRVKIITHDYIKEKIAVNGYINNDNNKDPFKNLFENLDKNLLSNSFIINKKEKDDLFGNNKV